MDMMDDDNNNNKYYYYYYLHYSTTTTIIYYLPITIPDYPTTYTTVYIVLTWYLDLIAWPGTCTHTCIHIKGRECARVNVVWCAVVCCGML